MIIARSQNNIQKLNLSGRISLFDDLEPSTTTQTFKDPKWRQAMLEEYDALIRNGTYVLPEPKHNIVWCKWIFHIKHSPDNFVDK